MNASQVRGLLRSTVETWSRRAAHVPQRTNSLRSPRPDRVPAPGTCTRRRREADVEPGAARLYLARNDNDGFGTERRDGGYNVIGRNGIQPLTPAEVREAEAEAAPKKVSSFPESWRGVWKGTLTISKPGREPERTEMLIVIRRTDDPNRGEFRLRYDKEQPQRRYELAARDAAAGQFEIDEKNGLVLPATYLDSELFSYFSLDGSLILARYRLVGDFLHFDLTQTSLTPKTKTGGEGVPTVGGHHVRIVQRAVLRR